MVACRFTIFHRDGQARTGRLDLPHGSVDTPVFMPVGTQATVKALSSEDLEALDARQSFWPTRIICTCVRAMN